MPSHFAQFLDKISSFLDRSGGVLVSSFTLVAITTMTSVLILALTHSPIASTRRPLSERVLAGSTLSTIAPSPTPSATPDPNAAALAAAAKKKAMTTATPSNTKSNPYGIAAGGGLGQMSDAQIRAQVKGMKDLGVQWVRFDIDWSTVQPDGAGTYNWRGYDTLVSALNTYGLSPLAVITYTPGWARIDGCNSEHCRPATAASFANFAGAAAQRYAGRGVRSWEIWNEPNWSEFWLPKPDPVFYTEMLTASYRAIKSVDTGSTVLTGGTAQANTSADAYSAPDFLNGIYQNGGKNFFDAVANHPYTFPFLPSYSWSWNKWLEMAQPGGVRGLMVSHGDSAKKVWITEYGAATNGPGSSANNGSISSDASADHVSDQLQARMITETVNLYRGLSWAGPLFWYTYQDDGTDVNNVEHFFGLLRADGSVKPAYQSYQQAIGSR